MNENIKVVHGTDFGVAPIYFYPHISGLLPTAPNGKEELIAMKPSHTLTYDKQCVAGRQSHASVMWRCVCLLRLPCSPPCSFLYILHCIIDTKCNSTQINAKKRKEVQSF